MLEDVKKDSSKVKKFKFFLKLLSGKAEHVAVHSPFVELGEFGGFWLFNFILNLKSAKILRFSAMQHYFTIVNLG